MRRLHFLRRLAATSGRLLTFGVVVTQSCVTRLGRAHRLGLERVFVDIRGTQDASRLPNYRGIRIAVDRVWSWPPSVISAVRQSALLGLWHPLHAGRRSLGRVRVWVRTAPQVGWPGVLRHPFRPVRTRQNRVGAGRVSPVKRAVSGGQWMSVGGGVWLSLGWPQTRVQANEVDDSVRRGGADPRHAATRD
jgi:hypothetical protein